MLALPSPASAHKTHIVDFDEPFAVERTFPAVGTPLPINGRIILEGQLPFVASAPLIWPPMDLRAAADRVPLRAIETFGSEVVLVPERELRPLTRYELHIDRPDKKTETVAMRAPEPGALAWTTSAAADHVAPRWRASPKIKAPSRASPAHRDESLVTVSVAFVTAEPVKVLAELRPIGREPIGSSRGGRSLLEPQEGLLEINSFSLPPGERYSLKLTAVDAAGNRSPAPGRPIEIVGPTAERRFLP